MVPRRRPHERAGLERLHAYAWGVLAIVVLSLIYACLQVGFVRPYLWPAGTGAAFVSDPGSALPLVARPPNVDAERGREAVVVRVAPGSPAAQAGLAPGDVVLSRRAAARGRTADFSRLVSAPPVDRLGVFREVYH